MEGHKGNYKGRADYKARKGGVESCVTGGNRGIPPEIKSPGGKTEKKGVETVVDGGDRGIPPMNVNPTASKPPID